LKIDFDARKNMSDFAYFVSKINTNLDKINNLLSMRKIVKNWIEFALFRLSANKTLTIQFKDGKSVYFKSKKEYNDFLKSESGQNEIIKMYNFNIVKIINDKIELNYHNNKIYFFFYDENKKLVFNINLIKENFINEEYKQLDVTGKDVIDVGSSIGDTAIYFAINGAKHVYSFEPYPYSYDIAKKNIKLNHFENKITLLNEGCGKDGFVTIKEDYENTGGTDLKSFKEGKKIKIESLDEIVKRFNLKHAELKVDCEGCEYDLILNASDEALKAFDQIIIEYHYGYRNLVKRLKRAGFKVKYGLPKYFHNMKAEDSDTYTGLIFATHIG